MKNNKIQKLQKLKKKGREGCISTWRRWAGVGLDLRMKMVNEDIPSWWWLLGQRDQISRSKLDVKSMASPCLGLRF